MITNNYKAHIQKVLGKHYAKKIIHFLTINKILNKNNEPFSNASVQQIVNGRLENIEVEAAILNYVNKIEKAKAKLQKIMNQKTTV